MADQSHSPSSPEGPIASDELNLTDSGVEKPRLKRRNLKPGARAGTTEPAHASVTGSESEPEPLPDAPRPDVIRPAGAAIPAAKPVAGNPYASAHPAPSAQSLPTTPLYYTTGAPKPKENAMKPNSTTATSTPLAGGTASANTTPRPTVSTTPSASSAQTRPAASAASTGAAAASSSPYRPAASATSASPHARPAASAGSTSASSAQARPASSATASSAQARPAAASPSTALSATVSSPGKATSVNDYRANVERQSREQKSVGGMISVIVYALAALFILGGFLAGYGAYVISKQIHRQSVTVSELDSRYTAQNQALTAQLKATNDSLTQALTQTQAQLARQQELLTRQQETLNRLVTATQDNASAWRQERQARAAETASLRVRMRDLEDQPRLHP